MAFCITWQTFRSPEISTVKLEPWTSTLTVWTDGVGDGEGDPPAGGEGFEVGLALDEGDEAVVPRTVGDAEAEGLGVADTVGFAEGDGFTEGLAEGLIEGFREALAKALVEGDGAIEGAIEGDAEMVWPNISGCLSATFSGKRIGIKNIPEPSKTAIKSPARIKVNLDNLIFFIFSIFESIKGGEESKKASLKRPS